MVVETSLSVINVGESTRGPWSTVFPQYASRSRTDENRAGRITCFGQEAMGAGG